MAIVVNMDGEIVAPEQARVSVFDRGFLYGDSVYEVVRTYGGRPFELDAHLRRLEGSAGRIALVLPWDRGRLSAEISRTLEAAGHLEAGFESYVRIIVTRGAGEIGLDPALAVDPRTVILARPLEQPPAEAYAQGVKVAVVAVQRNLREAVDPAAKTGNYLNNVMALKEARDRGAYEALMLDHSGRIAEGSSSNVFAVCGGRVCTPPLDVGILEGVTRRVVLECAREEGLAVDETELGPADLRGAEEAFLTSTVREIVPITTVDDAPVGAGAVGPVTRRIQAAFRRRTGVPLRAAF